MFNLVSLILLYILGTHRYNYTKYTHCNSSLKLDQRYLLLVRMTLNDSKDLALGKAILGFSIRSDSHQGFSYHASCYSRLQLLGITSVTLKCFAVAVMASSNDSKGLSTCILGFVVVLRWGLPLQSVEWLRVYNMPSSDFSC